MMEKLLRRLKLLSIVGVMTAFVGCASTTQKSESTGQYIDDSAVTAKVKAAIVEDPALKSMQVNVKTYQGVVQLSGFVDSPQQVQRAAQVASQVDGVKEVRNDLVVKK